MHWVHLLSEGSEVQILPGVPAATKSCDFVAVIFLSAGHFSPFFSKKIRHFSNGTGTVCPADSSNAGERFKIKACKGHKSEEVIAWFCQTGTIVKRICRVILFLSYKLWTVWFLAEAVHASAFLFSQSALPYPLKTAEKRCFYTFTRIYKPLFGFIIGKIFSTFFEKNFYKMVSLFPISEGVILARAPSGTLKTE